MIQVSEKTFNPIAWVDNHGDFLYAFAFAHFRDELTAESLVQETLLSALESIDNFMGESSERDWLTGILKNKILDHVSFTDAENQLTNEEADLSSYQYLFADQNWKDHWTPELIPGEWNIAPEMALEQKEFRQVLEHCLGELPTRIAKAFILREMDGLREKEICRLFGISKEDYWLMLHRAQTHLRRCLDFDWFKKGEIH